MSSERGETWFEDLFVAHGNRVAAYARRRSSEPDDVVAEVFATAWRHREKIPDPALPWLYRTAANVVLHHRRGWARRASLTTRLATADRPDRDPPDLAVASAARLDDVATVERLFAVLPPRDVEILRLWAWEQLTTDEIAYVLELSPGAARVRLHRARRRAEVLLAPEPEHGVAAARAAPARPTAGKTTPRPLREYS